MIEHHIQKEIMNRLSRATSLRFSDLKPEDMEANLFMYHLKQLTKMKYVTQLDDKTYTLTPEGMMYVDSLSLTNSRPRKQPKLISIIALKNDKGEYLLAERKLQPTINTWSIPSGKQHFGETPLEHARREVIEQIGQEVELERRGLLDIRISHQNQLITHLTAHLYGGDFDGDMPKDSEKFHYEWHAPTDDILFTPGTRELLEKLEQEKGLFFLSLDVKDD